MFSSKNGSKKLGFKKRVNDGIPIYTFIGSCQKYPTAVMEVTDDFRKNGYPAMVIDNDEEEKKTIKGLMPITEQEFENKENSYKGLTERFNMLKLVSFGATVPLVAATTYLSAQNIIEDPFFFSTGFSVLYVAGLLVTPPIVKKCIEIDTRNLKTDMGYLPLFEEALDRPEFSTLNNLD